MSSALAFDEELTLRLPLPLAKLYYRGYNAKSPIDRHQAAFYLFEVALKLLGSVCIVAYVEGGGNYPQIAELLKEFVRPSLGHWWEFVRAPSAHPSRRD